MNPWSIIGWILLGSLSLLVVQIAGPALVAFMRRRRRHYKTRNTPPAQWQVWMQGDAQLTITRIADNGRICLSTAHYKDGRQFGMFGSSASWSDSPEEWSARVRNRKLYLEQS